MTKSEKQKIEELVSLRSLQHHQKQEIYSLYRKYIDKSAVFCMVCDPSVRIMFKQFKRWWDTNTNHYTFIKPL